MGEKDPQDPNKSPAFRINLSKEPKTGLRDFVRQRKESQLAERERQKAEEQARREAEALESIPVKDHPLRKMPADLIDLYVKCVLILRAELPLAYSDPGEKKKQLRLFAKSLGISREHQNEREQLAARCGDQTKKDTLLELVSSLRDAEGMTCLMCDTARLHGAGYPFEGDFADFWSDAACGIADLADERLAAAEKLCRAIAFGGKLARAEVYAPIAEELVTYFGQEAFIPGGGGSDPNGKYLVIDLSGGARAKQYPFRWTDGDPDISKAVGRTAELWLRRIPAGTFTMGSPGGELGHCSDEISHQVTLTQDFFVGISPVTQRQWELVMRNNPSGFKSAGPGAPVEQVSYDDICGVNRPWPLNADVAPGSFLGRLRAKTELAGFDLPTEAQWEYACRAGTATALNNGKDPSSGGGISSGPLYELSNGLLKLINSGTVNVCPEFDEVGWYKGNGGGTTHWVCMKRPNAWGLYDMHGNVGEWCRDWYGPYEGDAIDPVGPAVERSGGTDVRRTWSPARASSPSTTRVCRGGGWFSEAKSCRSAVRDCSAPDSRSDDLGFRLVFVPER